MAAADEDTAMQWYERELARIDAERRARRRRATRILVMVAAVAFVLLGMVLSNAGHTGEWQLVDPPAGATIAISVLLGLITTIGMLVRHAEDLDLLEGILFFVAALVIASGLFGIVGFGYGSGANAWFDDSPREPHRVKVHDRIRKRSGKSLTSLPRLVVDSWRPGHVHETLYVPDAVFDANPDTVIVTTRAGFFGHAWIAEVAAAAR